MQNAGLQYGEGVTPVQESPFVSTPVQINPSNSTSSLRQFRKKDNVDKAAGASGGLSAANSAGTDSTNSSHVARVAPHNHYPHKQNEYFRYPPQYQEYSSPPVKYSEIAEPVIQPISHLDHLPPSVLSKHKEKEYVEMCNIPQQSHLNKPYPEHQFNGQQNYPPEMSMHHQYMHKEPQGSQIHSPYKPESQYIPKEGAFNHQIPTYLKYNIPQSRNYGPLDNSSLTPFQRMDPHLARSFMADHHHIREFPTEYSPMEQTRMYAQKQRYYPTPMPPSNPTYPPNYPHRNIPAQQYNYPSCNYPRTAQMNPSMGRYAMNMERSISPRRTYSENMEMTMNFPPVPQKIPANYPNYPAYAQHYQQRRPAAVPQEYYHSQQHPHSRTHAQYMPNHLPQEMPENHVASNNIRQYLENWAEEESTTEMSTTIENSKYISRINREEPNEVYVINASELPQYLENGVPLIASENGQYIFKSNVSIDNTGAIKIIDKTAENAGLPVDAQERVVSLHIIENPKTDCLVNRPPNVNQEHPVAVNQPPQGTLNLITANASHPNIDNTAQRSYNQPGYNTNRMNVHQVSPMTQGNPQNCETSINLSLQPNANGSTQQINRSTSGSPQKLHAENDQLKIQVLSYSEVPQSSCIVMPSTQNRLNFDESLLPNPVPCDLKQKKNENDANSVISNVINEEAILKEAHEELDKIVQDTLTSTNMNLPLESCERSQISKVEEKCGDDNINCRIPDYLNLDLEPNSKDSAECVLKNVTESVENEAIMDLSTTSRRTSKSENEEQEIPSASVGPSDQLTKDGQGQNTEKKDEESQENVEGGRNESTNEMDKSSIKHMPLIFDSFEENSSLKSDTNTTKSMSCEIQDENQEANAISFVEANKQELEEEEKEVNKPVSVDNQHSATELSKSITRPSTPTSSVEDTTVKEPAVEDEKSELLNESIEGIDQGPSLNTEKDETYENEETKGDKSNIDDKEDETNETPEFKSDNCEKKEQSVEDVEDNKIEKETESLEHKNRTGVVKSGIKRKRIFSVDDIIYRIGSTSNQIQNTSNDALDCKKENEKNCSCDKTDDSSIEQTGENKPCRSENESDFCTTKNESSQLPKSNENTSGQSKKDEGMSGIEETIDGTNEDDEKPQNTAEYEEKVENKSQAHNVMPEFEENEKLQPENVPETLKEDAKLIEESINITLSCETDETTKTEESVFSQNQEITLQMNQSPSENSSCEQKTLDNKQNQNENVDKEINELCDNNKIEGTKVNFPDDNSTKEVSPNRDSSEQLDKEENIMANDCNEIDLLESALSIDQKTHATMLSEKTDTIVSEETISVVKEENNINSKQNKIKILSNEILVQENKAHLPIQCAYHNNSEVGQDIKADNLKRNIAETDLYEDNEADDKTTAERTNKKIKLNENKEIIDSQENYLRSEVNISNDTSLEVPPLNSCRFSVIQRTETIQREVTSMEPTETTLENSAVPEGFIPIVPTKDNLANYNEENEKKIITETINVDMKSGKQEEHYTPLPKINIVEKFEEITTNTQFACDPEEPSSDKSVIRNTEDVEEISTNAHIGCELEKPTSPESDTRNPKECEEIQEDDNICFESAEPTSPKSNVINPEEIEEISTNTDILEKPAFPKSETQNPEEVEMISTDTCESEEPFSPKSDIRNPEFEEIPADANISCEPAEPASPKSDIRYFEEEKISMNPHISCESEEPIPPKDMRNPEEVGKMPHIVCGVEESFTPKDMRKPVEVEEILINTPIRCEAEEPSFPKNEGNPEEIEKISTNTHIPYEPLLSDVNVPGEIIETSSNPQYPYEPEELSSASPLSDDKIFEEVHATPKNEAEKTSTEKQEYQKDKAEPMCKPSSEITLTDEQEHKNNDNDHKAVSEDQNPRKKFKEEITFEQRFVEPLLKNPSENQQKDERQEEKPLREDCQYRSVLKIEENTVLLEICGELVEISVNQINGRKVITVVPISNSATVDINDNYEHADRTPINDQISNLDPDDNIQNAEMSEPQEVAIDMESPEEILPVLDKMVTSSEDIENVIRTEEISSTQTEVIDNSSEEIFEDIILNENEIIIGDESLEEEINLDLKSNETSYPEKPVLCTKAAKKLYEDSETVKQQPKPHSSLREFRKIKNKPDQQTQSTENIILDGQSDQLKEKKQPKGSTRTSTRQKNVSEQKEESQVALQELIKQRKMRKEKIRLKYPYIIDNPNASCEKLQEVNTATVKVRQEKEVRSEIRKVPKIEPDIVKTEKNQMSSVVRKVKGSDLKRRESSEIYGIKTKCKEKVRRRSVDEGKEKIHIVSSVIVKEPHQNLASDKFKSEEKPTSTSHTYSNPPTTGKEVSTQNFQDGRTSTNTEVAKNSNVQEKHSKFPKISTPRDLSLTKNINEHYLSRKDHSNLKKKLSIQEYNSRKRKIEETKVVNIPEKITRVEEPLKTHSLEKDHDRPSTIYSGRQFENVSNCVKDPRRLKFINSERPDLLRTKSEESSSSRAANISRSLSSGMTSIPPAITVNTLLNMVSTDNELKTYDTSIPSKPFEPKPINSRRKTMETVERQYKPTETHKRKVSFDDNVQINEIHTTQAKVSKSRLDSNSSYCEVTSSCSDNFEERSQRENILLCDDKIESTRIEYQNNLIKKIQNVDKVENNWEDSNSPKDCITDAFSDCFLERSRMELMKNMTKSKLIIDINDFDTSSINNELKVPHKTNSNSAEETLKNYKEEVDIKLNSLNIQIPKTTKNRVQNEDDLLMHKFLRKEQLNSDEIKQIRRIIYFKKKIQQITQQNVINNNKTTENKYEIKKSPESSSNTDLKLQLKKIDGKIKKKKKRFRNLYSNSPETSENEIQQSAGEFSVYEGENISGVKLIFKRKTDFLNLQPVVRLQRYKYIDAMAKKLKFE